MNKLLPYLNVLEVESVNKESIDRIVVIDKDEEVKVSPASSLGVSDYNELENKPIVNGVTLEGEITSDMLGVPSTDGTQDMIDQAIDSVRLTPGDGIDIKDNVISVDFDTIDKPLINGQPIGSDLRPEITFDSTNTKVDINVSLGDQTGSASIPVYDLNANKAGILDTNVFAVLNDKYTKEEMDAIREAIDRKLLGKQDDLIAGENISIIDNVISAFDNHFFVDLDSNDGWDVAYAFIKSHLDFYIYGYRKVNGYNLILPLVAYEREGSVSLYGYFVSSNILYVNDYTIVENGNIDRHYYQYDLDTYNKTEIDNIVSTLATKEDLGNYFTKEEAEANFVTDDELGNTNANVAALSTRVMNVENKFDDYYTKTDVDDKITSSIAESLDGYVSDVDLANTILSYPILSVGGGQVKTINGLSLYGSGNITIDKMIPILKFNYDSNTFEGDFWGVFNAVNNIRGVFSIYLPLGQVNRIEATSVVATGNNIQAAASITYNGTVNHIRYVIYQDGSYTDQSVTFNAASEESVAKLNSYYLELYATKQDLLKDSGDEQNIKTINGLSILGTGDLEIGGSGTTGDYSQLTNKPSINGVVLNGNKTYDELGFDPYVVNTIEREIADYALKTEIPTNNNQLENGAGYVTEEEVNNKVTVSHNSLSTRITENGARIDTLREDINNVGDSIPTDNAELTNGAGYVTDDDVSGKINVAYNSLNVELQALSNKVDEVESTVPTRTNQLYNDSGFITETEVSNTYATKASVTNLSAEVTSLGASVVRAAASSTTPSVYYIRTITMAEYNALPTKNSNTLYLIIE